MRGALALLLVACSGPIEPPASTITLRGRVVDAESCVSTSGCTGLSDMVVSLAAAPESVTAQPTGADGTFELAGVPVGYHQHLIVRPGDRASIAVAPTLNPMVVAPDDEEDLFGLELYVLPRDPSSLLTALREQGIDLVLGGGYVGQVVRVAGSTVTAADGVEVRAYPAPRSLRYINVLPRYVTGEPVLLAPETTTTGAFGMFMLEPNGPTDPAVVVPVQAGYEYELVTAPLEPGLVTYAIHRGSAL